MSGHEVVILGESLGGGRFTEEEARALRRQVRYGPSPSLTVDGVVLRGGEVLLIRRGTPPFEGAYALPGGFVRVGETVEAAVLREVREETGIAGRIVRLVGVYSNPRRDPRGHTVSIAFLIEPVSGTPVGGDDAAEARFFPIDALPDLAFDHRRIVEDAVRAMGV